LQNLRDQQALSQSYFDVLWEWALSALLMQSALLMRRSEEGKRSRISAE
jgi:hypothetical protein